MTLRSWPLVLKARVGLGVPVRVAGLAAGLAAPPERVAGLVFGLVSSPLERVPGPVLGLDSPALRLTVLVPSRGVDGSLPGAARRADVEMFVGVGSSARGGLGSAVGAGAGAGVVAVGSGSGSGEGAGLAAGAEAGVLGVSTAA
jgi:hypothetical protein